MRAVTVVPLESGSVDLTDLDEPPATDGPVLVETRAIGVCGTDIEIIDGDYGWAPPGEHRLTIGHESLGEVRRGAPGRRTRARRPGGGDRAPPGSRPVPELRHRRVGHVPQRPVHRMGNQRAPRVRPRALPHHGRLLVKVDPRLGQLGVLLEPTTVVAKAWDHIERIGARARWQPTTALITGAGPIGLLAALLGVQRGLEVHVLDQVADGLKPDLVTGLGATYHQGSVADTGLLPDVVIECTGVGQLILDVMEATDANGIVCLTGVSSAHEASVDVGLLNRRLVLSNDVVFGSVNANRRHYEMGATALADADPAWLTRLITRRVPLSSWRDAYERQPGDVKVVLEFDAGSG